MNSGNRGFVAVKDIYFAPLQEDCCFPGKLEEFTCKARASLPLTDKQANDILSKRELLLP
jgi:hypothetical protein